MENIYTPFVSVIIPVYNNVVGLKLCLEAIETQTYPRANYEVIIVDNDSENSGEIHDLVRQHRGIYTYQSIPSSYAARNQGISISQGEVLAFTDADCIPNCDWIEKGIGHLLSVPNCGLVAGKISIFTQNRDRLTAVEVYESIMALPQQEFIEVHNYGATANVFTWKKVMDEVGIFNPNLKSSGDVEWGQRVYAYKYQQVYAEDTCISHPARSNFSQLAKKTLRHTGGFYDLFNHNLPSFWQRQYKFIQYLCFNLTPPLKFAWKHLFNHQLKTFTHKIQIVYVMLFVRHITARELCRLKLGGTSTRD